MHVQETLHTAKEVVVLLNREFRISRNIRLGWYFEHLNCPIVATNISSTLHPKISDELGLQILSVIPPDKTADQDVACFLGTETKVTFVSSGYRFVFGLDLSASMLRADTFQHLVMIEAVLSNLEECLVCLLKSYTMHNSNGSISIKPDIYVTIFAQWHGTRRNDTCQQGAERVLQRVLVQGCLLTEHMISHILQKVEENIYRTSRVDEPGRHKSALQKRDDILIGILRTGLLALRLLPSNTSSGVIIITDGVLGEPDQTSLERLLSQCQNCTTSCSFIHVNPSAFPLCDFGCISNIELMKFIAQTTKGKYINTFANPLQDFNGFNLYQNALLPWSFQPRIDEAQDDTDLSIDLFRNGCSEIELRNINNVPTESPVLLSHKKDERTLRVDLLTVVSARLREGFEVTNVSIVKSIIEVRMELSWWKNSTFVEYRVSSSWPLGGNSTKVEVYISGTYEFLLDISKRHESSQWTRPRRMVLQRFLRFFQDLLHSDHMLSYLLSFTNEPVKYAISDALRQGQTLYYLPPNSTQFELSAQAQHTPPAFSSYWKPILSLDANIWQQWLHIHRIEVILQHDVPLPKHLHSVGVGGRYHSVQCRVAFSQLVSMLRDWCTFVLLENHTYVKFINNPEANSDVPRSFFLVRLSNKSPALVLKLAFLIGLSGKVRKEYVNDLRDKVASLSAPSTSSAGSSTKRVRHTSSRLSPNVRSNRTHYSASDKPCAILMHKPVDQVLVRYNQTPNNYQSTAIDEPRVKVRGDISEQFIRMRDMQWYLQHERGVWSLTNNTATPLSIDVACHLADLLLKVRMVEGYHIAHSTSGIINLMREFPMQPSLCEDLESPTSGNINDFCLVQFVIFPPKLRASDSSLSAGDSEEEDDDDETTVIQKEIIFAAEVWVEPQNGVVRQAHQNVNPNFSPGSSSSSYQQLQSDILCDVPYYEGLCCDDISKAIIQKDTLCISNIVTLEHLQMMCSSDNMIHNSSLPQKKKQRHFNSQIPSPHEGNSRNSNTIISESNLVNEEYPRMDNGSYDHNFKKSSNIQYFSCVFDLVLLLEQSPRVKQLFMTLAEDTAIPDSPNTVLFANFHKSLEKHCESVIPLSADDQRSITQHIIERNNSDLPINAQKNVTHLTEPSQYTSKGLWSCYLKKGENGQVCVILLPATYSDFLKLQNVVSDKASGDVSSNSLSTSSSNTTVISQTPSRTSLSTSQPCTPQEQILSPRFPTDGKTMDFGSNFRLNRRISIKRLASTNSENHQPQDTIVDMNNRTLPVYVYNCSMQMLVSGTLQSVRNPSITKWPDSFQDHRFHTLDVDDEFGKTLQLLSPTKEPQDVTTANAFTSTETNDDVFPLASPENNQLYKLCNAVVDLYHRSFVKGVFSAVQSETKPYVSTDDLQIATDFICQEYVDEIDVTDFLLLNCPQVAEFRSRNFQLNILNDFDLQSNDLFQSDDPDIEDICLNSDVDLGLRKPVEGLVEMTNSVTTDGSLLSSDIKFDQSKMLIADGLVKKDSIDDTEVSVLPAPETPDTLTLPDQARSLPTSVTIPLHRKSAFTTVHRHSTRSRKSECENGSTSGSSSSVGDEHEKSSRKRKAQLQKRERKITTTLPVKRVDARKLNSVCLQTGWNNLPEFPLADLNVPHLRHLSGTNEQVEKHFHTLLKAYCHPVSSLPGLYYSLNSSNVASDSNPPSANNVQADSDIDEVQFGPFKLENTETESSVEYTGTLGSTMPSYYEEDEYSMSSDDGKDTHPLFLYITCSVRDKKTGNCGNMPVKGLPVNLKSVLTCLENPCTTVDLSELQITLDLIWIYLPPATNELKISSVPSECLPCVEGIKKSITWLLEDEIISSLRTSEPISETTLNKVAKHIVDSKSSNGFMSPVPLHFILDVEKSKSLFSTEFERLRMENYKLKKEGHFYYLSLERVFIPIADIRNYKDSIDISDNVVSPQSFAQESPFCDKSSSDANIDGEFIQTKCFSTPHKPPLFNIVNQPLSPMLISPKAGLTVSITPRDGSPKTTSNLKHGRSSCVSLFAMEADNSESGKVDLKIKKASSSIDLSSSNPPARRCTSGSSIPFNETAFKEKRSYSRPSPLRPQSDFQGTPSPTVHHHSLRASLSCGKDATSFYPLNSNKGNFKSMPVTPLGYTNVELDSLTQFVFPSAGAVKIDGRQSLGRDHIRSPSSDCSQRQYSQASWIGSGYEGEESDIDEEIDNRDSLQEAYNQLPNFWLIIWIKDDCANVYFHRRSSAKVWKPVKKEHTRIFNNVIDNLKSACKAVNQTLLLKKLHDTRVCHPLLVEESAEDIWKKDEYSALYQQTSVIDDQNVEDSHGPRSSDYLAATMNFPPGYFECRRVLQQFIFLHHRITGSTPSSVVNAAPSALTTVRSFMKNFAILNQKNMFVFQVQDGTVYYCRMHEDTKKQESSGRRSSLFQCDLDQSLSSSASLRESKDHRIAENEPKLHLVWYGVHELAPDHLNDLDELKDGIERKLDEAVLEYITLMLSRNSMFKLTPADVMLIQPRHLTDNIVEPKPPDDTISFALPLEIANERSMPSLLYYIHQNILQFLTVPRYTEPTTGRFLPFAGPKTTPYDQSVYANSSPTSSCVYLFNEMTEKGRKCQGIACICLDVSHDKNLQSSQHLILDKDYTIENFEKLCEVSNIDHSNNTKPTVHFHIWARGSLKTDDLRDQLRSAIQHALCDVLTECLVCVPLTPFVKTDAMKSLFDLSGKAEDTSSLQSFLQSKFGNVAKASSKSPATGKPMLPGDTLNGIYHILLPQWFQRMKSLSCPSVSYAGVEFKSRSILDQGMSNIVKLLSAILPDSSVMLYYKIQGADAPWKYTDTSDIKPPLPGQYYQWILITRNLPLWKKCTGTLSGSLKPHSATVALQKFAAYDVSVKPEASPCPQHDLVMSSSYIPRQHFVYLVTRHKSASVFMYNIASDKSNSICQQLQNCAKFHNARHNMLQGLTFQKLGLFKHYLTKEAGSVRNHDLEHYSVDFLARHTKMPNPDKKKQRFTAVDQYFDDLLLDSPPATALKESADTINDKITLYGQQCFSIVRHKLQMKEARMHLKSLFRRNSANVFTVSSTTLNVILSFARLVHNESSPILLGTTARRENVKLFSSNDPSDKSKADKSDSKSHSVLSRTSSFLGTYRRRSGDSLSKMSDKEPTDLSQKEGGSDICKYSFEYMAGKFSELYNEHWRGFLKLQLNSPTKKEQHGDENKTVCNQFLYRQMPGGIALVSYAYMHDRFDVKLYCIDISPTSEHSSPNSQKSHVNFMNECEKFKDHMEVHMFSLEMHIRCIQWYLNGTHSPIMSGYNLTDLLQGLVVCYGGLLGKVSSQIYHDTISIPCNPVTCHELFDFIVENASIFRLKFCVVRRESKLEKDENILYIVGQAAGDHASQCSVDDHHNHNICVVISKAEDCGNDTLKLQYYILLSHKNMPGLSKDLSRNNPVGIKHVKANLSRRFSEVTDASFTRAASWYHRKASVHEPVAESLPSTFDLTESETSSIPSFVACEKANVENMINSIGKTAKTECYRHHHIWDKMVLMCRDKGYNKALTIADLNKLLELMQVIPASKFDPKIHKIFPKYNRVKQGHNLQKRLLKHFPQTSTSFVSADGSVHNVCVFSTKDVHAMVVVQVDSNKKEIDIFLVVPLPEYNIFHTGDIEFASRELLLTVCNVACAGTWLSWL